MKTHLLIATLFCMAANVLGATFVNGLDPAHKVQVETVSAKGSCVVTFNGHKYYLDGNTIYLDGELTDQQAASSTFIYNNVKEAFEALNVGPESTSIKTLLSPLVFIGSTILTILQTELPKTDLPLMA